jgi:putative inorganic carbon (HCO3(-)) transporter
MLQAELIHGVRDKPRARLDRAQLGLVCVGAFLLPLVVLWSTNDPIILPKLLTARALILLLAALFLARWLRGEMRIRRTPLDLPILAYVASAGASTLFAANLNLAFFGSYGRLEGFLTIATYAALFWLTVQSVSNPVEGRAVLRAVLAGAFVASVIAILQAVAGGLTAGPTSSVARAAATFGNANALAAYLAMALAVGVNEYLRATSTSDRILAGNAVAMLAIALVLSFGRGGWVGGVVGVMIVIAIARPSLRRITVMACAAAGLIAAIVLAIAILGAGGAPIAQSTAARVLSLFDPTSGTGAIRLHIWKDTLAMIASRPLVGYGPDNFGLVFPTFQTGSWARRSLIDESHSELLQIVATQGILGLAAFAWLCIAFVRLWWRGRHQLLASGVLGACVAYLLTLLVNFSTVPAALPFWIFLGAAAVILQGDAALGQTSDQSRHTGSRPLQLALGLLALAALAPLAIAMPYSADAGFHDALTAFAGGDRGSAARLVAGARSLQPQQQAYAAAAGNVAMADADWTRARDAYTTAARLGSFDPSVFRQLAIADQHLGLQAEAVAAAKRSVELNRFDPRNRAVLQAVTAAPTG